MSGNAPVKKFRLGLVTTSIWKNGSGDKTFYTVTVQVGYKDAEGKWQSGDNLNSDQLLNAAWCLTKCNGWIAEQ